MAEKKTRRSGDELENFVVQGSAIDSNLSNISISDSSVMDTGIGVMNELLNEAIDGQTALVSVKTRGIKGNKGKPVYTFVSLSYIDDGTDVSISLGKNAKKLTAYDKRTINAIGTLYLAGRKTFSITELFSVANGYANKRPNKRQLEALERSVRKVSQIRMTMDIAQEILANNFADKQLLVDAGILKDIDDNVTEAKFEDILVPAKIASITTEKGMHSVSITILSEPLLLTYNRAKKSLLSIPMEYLCNENLSLNERSIAIQDYLLRRVVGYKKGYYSQNKIVYQTILSESGLEAPENYEGQNRVNKSRDRDLIQRIFDSWVKTGLVDSYKEIFSGAENNSYIGVEFVVQDKIEEHSNSGKHLPEN